MLKDLKVLDVSNGIAGPMSGYVLAQYCAEVIKLDTPNLMPYVPLVMMEVGQGKRSLLADLKTAPGQEILRRLVSWADVVVHNNLDKVIPMDIQSSHWRRTGSALEKIIHGNG